MLIAARAIILSVRPHGEHGAVVRSITRNHGLMAGFVSGARSRRLRPILSPGNLVAAEFSARSETELASLKVEPVTSRAQLLSEPLAAAAVEWVTALAAVVLPEGHPYPLIFDTLDAMLVAIDSASTAREWVPALARYEALMLSELGYAAAGESLAETGLRLRGDLLTGRQADILPARDRLLDRIARSLGR